MIPGARSGTPLANPANFGALVSDLVPLRPFRFEGGKMRSINFQSQDQPGEMTAEGNPRVVIDDIERAQRRDVRAEPERFEPLLDSDAAAKLLQIHPKTLQKLARAGRVPAHSVCGLWRFRASELDEWLKTEVSSKSHSRSN